jgi:cell shape-determining protein MreC
MAMRWREHYSEMYRVEDSPDAKQNGALESYIEMAKAFKEEATKLRDQFYTRKGQSLQPLFGTVVGSVKDSQPRN